MTNGAEYLIMYLLDICNNFSYKGSVQIFACSMVELFIFLLLSYKISLYILDTSFFSHIYIYQVLSKLKLNNLRAVYSRQKSESL